MGAVLGFACAYITLLILVAYATWISFEYKKGKE